MHSSRHWIQAAIVTVTALLTGAICFGVLSGYLVGPSALIGYATLGSIILFFVFLGVALGELGKCVRHLRMSQSALDQGLWGLAETHSRKALEHARRAHFQRDIGLGGTALQLMAALGPQRRYREGAQLLEEIAAEMEPLSNGSAKAHTRLAFLYLDLAEANASMGRIEETEQSLERAVAHQANAGTGPGSSLIEQKRVRIESDICMLRGKVREAIVLQRREIGLATESEHEAIRGTVGGLRLGLAASYLRAAQHEAALAGFREVLKQSLESGNSTLSGIALLNLSGTLADAGRAEEAEVEVRKALELHEERLPPNDPNLALPLLVLVQSLAQRPGRLEPMEEALARLSQWDEWISEHFQDDWTAIRAWATLARGETQQAETAFRALLQHETAKYGSESPRLWSSLRALSVAVEQLGRADEAAALRERMLALEESHRDVVAT